ncbi:hypothetical protein WG66_009236 [Moniliophthora roreri]|nr:hypothetical protein WG66_009236 [Moniliophthora roreri]
MFAISTSWMVTASIKLEATFFKSFSLFDKRGDIYAFRIVDDEDPQYLFKVGRTSRPLEERMIEWDRQCPSKVHIWHEGILVAHSHRVERLVHLELMARGYERVIEMCPDCVAVFYLAPLWPYNVLTAVDASSEAAVVNLTDPIASPTCAAGMRPG